MDEERYSPETGKMLRRGVRPEIVEYKGHTITVEQPGWYGEDEDDGIISSADAQVADQAYFALKIKVDGLLDPAQILRIRKKLKLTQKRAGEIIGGGANAFQKYEAGDVVASRAMSHLLRLLDRHPELLAEIEGQAAAQPDAAA